MYHSFLDHKGWKDFFAALVISYNYGAMLGNTDSTVSALISVFSILAGVLIAVISIIGDPSMLLPGNWRLGWEHAQEMQKKISNYSNLFLIYILALILLIVCGFWKDNDLAGKDFIFATTSLFALFALLLSIPLPYGLMAIQSERMDGEVAQRKNKISISKRNTSSK